MEQAQRAGVKITETPGGDVLLAGSVSSAVVGFVAIRFLLRFLANHTLRIFAYYRFVLAAVVAVAFLSASA